MLSVDCRDFGMLRNIVSDKLSGDIRGVSSIFEVRELLRLYDALTEQMKVSDEYNKYALEGE